VKCTTPECNVQVPPENTVGLCTTCYRTAVRDALDGPSHDPVNHPAHYTRGGIEVIDAIEAWKLDFHRGNAVKYIARAGAKDPRKELEDLQKARWYLDRAIKRLGGQ
jgi:hypothetical protein